MKNESQLNLQQINKQQDQNEQIVIQQQNKQILTSQKLPFIGFNMSMNILGTKITIIKSNIQQINPQSSISQSFYTDILIFYKQSSENQQIYPTSQLNQLLKDVAMKQEEPIQIVQHSIAKYKQIMKVDIDYFKKQLKIGSDSEKYQNYLMQKVVGQILDVIQHIKCPSFTIPYLWNNFQEKASKMMIKMIQKRLQTSMLINGKPLIDRIVLLINDPLIFVKMSQLFSEQLFKIKQSN